MADGSGAPALSGAAAGLVCSETSQNPTPLQTLRHRTDGFRAERIITREEQRSSRLRRMRKTVITAARIAVDEAKVGGFRGRWAMLTLTYREDVRWVAKQLAVLTDHLRKYAARNGFVARYVWALELTKRGRPHYHLLVWLPKGRTLPKPDKQGWWAHGLTRIEWARNAVGYLAKYASKGIEGEAWDGMPKGARMCGNGGISRDGRVELRYWKLPTWVREVFNEITDVARTKGGYVERTTGEYLASPWRVTFIGGVVLLLRKQP